MRIGINGSGQLLAPNLAAIADDIALTDSEGLSSYWLAQNALVDSCAALGIAGRGTSLTLGTAVVPTWERHPHALAAQALTTQAAVDGTFVLGIGLAHQPTVESRLNMTWERPIRHMNEYLDVLLPLLSEGIVSVTGDIWSYMGSGGRPTERVPSVMLAALGEQMLKIAGRRTDGTILWCVGPRTIEQQIRPHITAAADSAGRSAPSIVCSLPVWVTSDVVPAKTFVGEMLRDYAALPSYRAMLDIEGVQGIESISLIGSADKVHEELARIQAAGATDFTAVVLGGNPDEIAATRAALASYPGS